MSIAQKIYELRREIMRHHPDAKLVAIELTKAAEMALTRELTRERVYLASALEVTRDPDTIKTIFGITVKVV